MQKLNTTYIGWLLLAALALLLAACGQASGSGETAVTTDEAEIPAAAEDAAADVAADDNAANDAPMPTGNLAITPATSIAAAAELRDRDWTKGNPDAGVVIIEYGDFQ